MRNKNIVLVDYENVQPDKLDSVGEHSVEILLFIGYKQAKIPIELASSMQDLGYNARYVQASGGGKNALDFYIAFYAGKLAAANPEAHFHIISRDKGFDPLVKHLTEINIRAERIPSIWDLPFIDQPAKDSMDELIRNVVNNFSKRGSSRPRKVATLTNTIARQFCSAPGMPKTKSVMEELRSRNLIEINGTNVKYRPPITST